MDTDKCSCNLRHHQTQCDCQNRVSNCSCNTRATMCDCVARFTNENIMNDVSYKGINEYILAHGINSQGVVYEGIFHPDKTIFNKKYDHLRALINAVNNDRTFDPIPSGNMTKDNITGSRCINNVREEYDKYGLSLGDIHKVVSNLSKCSCNSRKSEGCFCQNRQFNNCSCNVHNDTCQCNTRTGAFCDCNGRCSCNQVAEYSTCNCVSRGTPGQTNKQRCNCNVRNDYW